MGLNDWPSKELFLLLARSNFQLSLDVAIIFTPGVISMALRMAVPHDDDKQVTLLNG